MKKTAMLVIAVFCIVLTACNGTEVAAIIGDISQSVISILGIEGKLSASTQQQLTSLSSTAQGDYQAVVNAPAADKATALLKFQTSWNAFLNLANPILQDAHANPAFVAIVDICLSQVTTVTNIVAAAQPSTLGAHALRVDAAPKSEAEYRAAFNAEAKRFGNKYTLDAPAHQKVNHAAGKLKFWRW